MFISQYSTIVNYCEMKIKLFWGSQKENLGIRKKIQKEERNEKLRVRPEFWLRDTFCYFEFGVKFFQDLEFFHCAV